MKLTSILAKGQYKIKLISCYITKKRNYSSRFPKAVKLAYSVYSQDKVIPKYEKTNVTPIIIVHGMFGSKSNWTTLNKTISAKTGRTVIAIDIRNHGESEWSSEFTYDVLKDDLLSLMDQLSIDKVNLLGHSLGGRIVMNTTLLVPDKVEKLIVVDVSPVRMSAQSPNLLYMIQRMKATQFPRGIKMSEARKLANEALEPVTASPAMRQFLVTNIREKADKTFEYKLNLAGIEKGMPNISQYQFPKAVFNGPTLFIGGELSDYLKPDHHNDILALFPKSTFKYIKGAGHWLHAEKPGEFLALVNPFFKV